MAVYMYMQFHAKCSRHAREEKFKVHLVLKPFSFTLKTLLVPYRESVILYQALKWEFDKDVERFSKRNFSFVI